MPEKTLALNSCIFLVKHIVAKTIEQLQQHLKKTYSLRGRRFKGMGKGI